jgi:superfamily I DNA and RNA helicase and helicase subunits-like protein
LLGKDERYLFVERLQQVFHQDFEMPEKNHKPVCLIGLKCDEQRKYIPGDIQVSSLVWGIHQLLSHADQLTKKNMADFLSMDTYKSDMQSFDMQLVEVTEEGHIGQRSHFGSAEFYYGASRKEIFGEHYSTGTGD